MNKSLNLALFLYRILFLHVFSAGICFAGSDMEALLKMKSSITRRGKSWLHDWRPSSSPSAHCAFSGVSCDSDFRVVALNISGLPIYARIPPEIGMLDKLVNLSLDNNNFTGSVPLEMANLISLKYLNLSNNIVTDDFPGGIAFGFTQLEVLDIYNNDFSGPLPIEFGQLKKLKWLDVGGSYFSGAIPEVYTELQSLEYFSVQGNDLTGRLPASFARLKKLREFYVGIYNIYDGGIPPEYGFMSSLRVLDLSYSSLTGIIPATLGRLKHLHTLYLHWNHFTGHIPPELSALVSLKEFDLSFNELTGEIPESLSALKNVTLFSLFSNKLHGPIPAFIGDLPHLEVLLLWNNSFTRELPINLGYNGKFSRFDVSGNNLTGLVPMDLCKGHLQHLILMNNHFIGPIPEGIAECESLTRIRIDRNYLNGTIPAKIFNFPNLEFLDVSNNYFSGELPSQMSSYSLGTLILSNNHITGKIPATIGNLENLRILSLEHNQFTGGLPMEIFTMSKLLKINISASNLTGEIPNSLSQCTTLSLLDLSCNNFVGPIPARISKLTMLSVLNLSGNGLTGEIPTEIGSIMSLTTLDLSYNDFRGRVPNNGQFSVFNSSAFMGNPNLCFSSKGRCPSLVNSDHSLKNYHKKLNYGTVIIPLVMLILLCVVLAVVIRKKKIQKSGAWKVTMFQRLDVKAEDVVRCLTDKNIIRKGSASVVYLGSMPDGSVMAIKQLSGNGQSNYKFSAEIHALRKIQHRNIVRLLGYVSNSTTNLFLYEYMPNGSLYQRLHGAKGEPMQWDLRYKIAVEAAKGLCHLHHDCTPPIIHRDVKSNNILLDNNYVAHVSDFGLAKFLQNGEASECMPSTASSHGYLAPEYGYTQKVDDKSDVYSFGVVLLELIVGKKPMGDFGEGVDLVMWVIKATSELSQPSGDAAVVAVVDSRLSEYPLQSVVHLFKVAMMCVEEDSRERPTMRDVVHMLTNLHDSSQHSTIIRN